MRGKSFLGSVRLARLNTAAIAVGLVSFMGFAIPAEAQVSIAVGLSSPQPAAIDPTGGYLYFGQQNQTNCAAELDRLPAGSSNGTWSTVLSGFGYRDGYGACRGVGGITFAGSKMVVSVGGYDDESIYVANLDGSGSHFLVSSNYGGSLIGVVNGVVYYMTNFSQIAEVPLNGGHAVSDASSWFVRSLVIDRNDGKGGVIYFTDYYTDGVWRFDTIDKTSQELISGATQ
jgi:hypothetical protein